VPRLRRLVSRQVRPHLLNIWANVKTIATEPHKIFYVLAGSTLAQLLVILAAVLIERFFTAYLPPVWGWATLAWMRRREYV